jgi:hypothetical protein
MTRRRVLVGAYLSVLALVGAGCSSSSKASTPVATTAPPVSTTTTSTIPGQAASAGCSATAARPAAGTIAQHVTTAGVVHPYLLSVPTAYRPNAP